jgi:uncharacterized protein YecT (DUF1311 family)
MPARGFRLISAAFALVALAACGDNAKGASKTEASSEQRIAAALNTCADAHNDFARNVCANHALAGLDTQIRTTLVAQAANVSDAGAQMLVENQRRWLEAQRVACGVIDPATPPTGEQQTCLEGEFRARAQEARNAVQEVGSYTFQRMELTNAAPVTAEVAASSGLGDDAPHAIIRDIRFPRIDGQQTPQIQRFNELVAQQPQFRLEDATNEVVDYHIAYAGPELISVRFDVSEDTLGAAHPNSTYRAVTVLMSDGHALTENDVFTPNSGWQQFVTQRAVREITRQFSDYDFTPPERDVQESATKPHLWLVTERGLVILFPPYSFGGPYALGGAEVTIPWADLRPYLSPSAPSPIRATS